ncbi:MAG: SCO family protein [Proteobacteria bacterium]|nr:SCO family protein [Pseudomonadota bacterium]
MTQRGLLARRPAWSVAVLPVVAVAAGAFLSHSLQRAPSIGGAFELLDRDSRPFTDANLRGRPFAIYFGYTRCPDARPRSCTWRTGVAAWAPTAKSCRSCSCRWIRRSIRRPRWARTSICSELR